MKDIAAKQKQQKKPKEDDHDADIKERLQKLKQKHGMKNVRVKFTSLPCTSYLMLFFKQ